MITLFIVGTIIVIFLWILLTLGGIFVAIFADLIVFALIVYGIVRLVKWLRN